VQGRHHARAKYVLDYLAHSFPTQLFRAVHRQRMANLSSRPVYRDGKPVLCRDARRTPATGLIERLAALASPCRGAPRPDRAEVRHTDMVAGSDRAARDGFVRKGRAAFASRTAPGSANPR